MAPSTLREKDSVLGRMLHAAVQDERLPAGQYRRMKEGLLAKGYGAGPRICSFYVWSLNLRDCDTDHYGARLVEGAD